MLPMYYEYIWWQNITEWLLFIFRNYYFGTEMGVECLFRLLIYRQRARAGRGEEIKRIPKKEGERGMCLTCLILHGSKKRHGTVSVF